MKANSGARSRRPQSGRVREYQHLVYELMDRLETAGLVEGRYEERDVLGQLLKERKYKITGLGQHAAKVVSYYAARLGSRLRLERPGRLL